MNRIAFAEDDAEVPFIAAYLAKHDIDVIVEPRRPGGGSILTTQPDLVYWILCFRKDGMTICRDLLRHRWQAPGLSCSPRWTVI